MRTAINGLTGIDSEDTNWEVQTQNQRWVMLLVWTWLWGPHRDTPCESGGSSLHTKFTTGRKVSSDLALALLWPAFVSRDLGHWEGHVTLISILSSINDELF